MLIFFWVVSFRKSLFSNTLLGNSKLLEEGLVLEPSCIRQITDLLQLASIQYIHSQSTDFSVMPDSPCGGAASKLDTCWCLPSSTPIYNTLWSACWNRGFFNKKKVSPKQIASIGTQAMHFNTIFSKHQAAANKHNAQKNIKKH